MTEQELAAFAIWLRQTQGVEIDPDDLREPAGAAVRLGAVIGEAVAELPFGAEPSGFDAAIAKLATAGQGGDDDVG